LVFGRKARKRRWSVSALLYTPPSAYITLFHCTQFLKVPNIWMILGRKARKRRWSVSDLLNTPPRAYVTLFHCTQFLKESNIWMIPGRKARKRRRSVSDLLNTPPRAYITTYSFLSDQESIQYLDDPWPQGAQAPREHLRPRVRTPPQAGIQLEHT
jgi:hypothetical protein